MSAAPNTTTVRSSTEARLELPGLHSGPVTVLSTNLDSTVWVRFPSGGTMCVNRTDLVDVDWLPAPSNPLGLNTTEIEVLIEFAAAGADGLADFEHTANAATVANARRTLISRGLVIERRGESRTGRGKTGHVWAITSAGRSTLASSRPPRAA
jgi:hypothetical protein